MRTREMCGVAAVVLGTLAGVVGVGTAQAPKAAKKELPAKVESAEKKRVEVIKKIKPTVCAVLGFDPRTREYRGSGSGVLISDDGLALTNFHVVAGKPPSAMKVGLPDGLLYDAVLVGLDRVGDIALIKLLPRDPGKKFPYAVMGDSDTVKVGDWSIAAGNPMSVATDFTPTVTFGIISGVNRYVQPAPNLEYTAALQFDTAINPGSSGGPHFNMAGELIGINGAGSFVFGKRTAGSRFNSGNGYAISINQVKNFMGHLLAGLDTDHASIGAQVESESEDGALSRVLVRTTIDSDARRRGLDIGDQLVSFAGRPMTSVNVFKSTLGLFPRDWRVPMSFRRDNVRTDVLVRLMGVQRAVIEDRPGAPGRPVPPGKPAVVPGPAGPGAKLYKAKAGFANYHFNEVAQRALLTDFARTGDFSKLKGDWQFKFTGKQLTAAGAGKDITAVVLIKESGAADGKSPKVLADFDGLDFPLEPLNPSEKADAFKDPPDSGGFVLAMYLYRQFLVYGPRGFPREFHHGGVEPFYPPVKEAKPDYMRIRVLANVIRGKFAGIETRWYFAREDDKAGRWQKGQMIGFEATPDKDEDGCEVCLSHYKDFGGRKLPSKVFVRKADKKYADLTLTEVKLN